MKNSRRISYVSVTLRFLLEIGRFYTIHAFHLNKVAGNVTRLKSWLGYMYDTRSVYVPWRTIPLSSHSGGNICKAVPTD